MLAQSESWGMSIREHRTSVPGVSPAPVALRGGFIRTAGFASACLVFHPRFQSDSTFRYLGRQTVDGQPTHVIAFAQQPEKAHMIGRFDVSGVSSPVLVQGVAWVEPDAFRIIRMRTDLLKPLPKVRLAKQTTAIRYGEVQFRGVGLPLWLPREVTVTVQWKGRTFRNTHRYSDFRLFNVETEERRKQVTAKPELSAPPS